MPLTGRNLRLLSLAFVPIAVGLEVWAPERYLLIFATSAIAILPLAAFIAQATADLADRLGGGIGGLLNATFGNATELIIGALALRAGLTDLVKASLTGSIIGNVLLVFGLSALVGGLRHRVQRFNQTAAGLGATMLLLSVIGLVVPAVFHWLSREQANAPELALDTEIAVVLFVTYCASMVFTLRTHRHLYNVGASDGQSSDAAKGMSVGRAMLMLLASTVTVAVISELLVGSVAKTAEGLGVSQLFMGVIVVGLVGNAAEHYSAVTLAAQNRMDAALAIAVGSSTQIALFVAPMLVFVSYVIAPKPMDLLFTVFELVAIGLSVLSISFISHDGETNWMEGAQLLAVYVILALGFFLLPG